MTIANQENMIKMESPPTWLSVVLANKKSGEFRTYSMSPYSRQFTPLGYFNTICVIYQTKTRDYGAQKIIRRYHFFVPGICHIFLSKRVSYF